MGQFRARRNLWIVNIATGEITTLTNGGSEEILKGKLDWVYPEELDTRTAYWWSPDSSTSPITKWTSAR